MKEVLQPTIRNLVLLLETDNVVVIDKYDARYTKTSVSEMKKVIEKFLIKASELKSDLQVNEWFEITIKVAHDYVKSLIVETEMIESVGTDTFKQNVDLMTYNVLCTLASHDIELGKLNIELEDNNVFLGVHFVNRREETTKLMYEIYVDLKTKYLHTTSNPLVAFLEDADELSPRKVGYAYLLSDYEVEKIIDAYVRACIDGRVEEKHK